MQISEGLGNECVVRVRGWRKGIRAALLVEPDDVRAMTEGIRVLLEDEEWRSAAARRALAAAAQYSWEKTARDTVDVYRKVLMA